MTFLAHLTPTDEAQMIREAATRWAASIADTDIWASEGYAADRWAAMTDLGWHGVLVPEDCGGLGLGLAEAALLCEVAGGARLPEPLVASSIICAGTLAGLDNGADLAAALAGGDRLAAPVGFGLPCDGITTPLTAEQNGDGITLSGTAPLVEAGPDTTLFLVYATGETPVLATLDREAPGLTLTPYRAIDGRHLARLDLAACAIPTASLLATGPAATNAAKRGDALAVAGLAADALGTIEAAIKLTTEYLNGREQFGRKLATFQALRHMVADLTVEAAMTRSMVALATYAADQVTDPTDLLDRVRARVCRAAQAVGQTTIQLHGGMGMTDEMAIGHYFRRLIFLQAMMGQEAGALRDRSQAIAAEIAAEQPQS